VRAVVTGGAGFIGSHVVEALLGRGDEVTIVDNLSTGRRENVRDGATLVEADIRDPLGDVFADGRPDVVVHLAAQIDVRRSVADPAYDAAVNVIGTVNVLEAARAHDAQVVFSSTGGAIYGECDGPAPESAERRPISPYGTSKLAAEEYLAAANRLYGSGHVSLRYGNVYGPRQDPHGEAGVVAIFFNCFLAGTTPKIYGDGRQTRDYVYAGDVARATVAAIGAGGGVYNVGTGRETSVLELYELCRDVAGVNVDAEHAPERPGELLRSAVDVSLAERDVGWRPETELADGLRETWAYFSGRSEA
jgi:UDP-glucose 4-epimerase